MKTIIAAMVAVILFNSTALAWNNDDIEMRVKQESMESDIYMQSLEMEQQRLQMERQRSQMEQQQNQIQDQLRK